MVNYHHYLFLDVLITRYHILHITMNNENGNYSCLLVAFLVARYTFILLLPVANYLLITFTYCTICLV